MDQRRVPIYVCLIPMAVLVTLVIASVWMSFRQPGAPGDPVTYGTGAFSELFGDPMFRKTLLNTALFALSTILTSLFFGVTAAWLVERTNLRSKEIVRTIIVMGLLIPSFLSAMGWVLLAQKKIGVINSMIQDIPGFGWFNIDISHPLAMGFVQGLGLSALMFVMVSATFRAMNPALEEAAAIHGMGFFRRLRRITLPLSFPGILAAGIYISTIAIAAFEVPAMIGLASRVFTFSTYVFTKINPLEGLPRYDIAGAFGVMMIVIGLLLMWWYFRTLRQSWKYVVVSGKAYRPTLITLGRWQAVAWAFLGLYFLMAQITPLLILVWMSFLPYPQPISLSSFGLMTLDYYRELPWETLLKGARNTGILAVSVPTITLAVSMAFSWVVIRSKMRFRFVFDIFAFLPHAIPHILLAVAAIYVVLFLLPGWLPLYGTIYLLIIMYVVVYISFATRTINSALLQIHEELDEAATVSGIPLLRTIWRILLPLLRPTLLTSWLWIALLTYRELTMASVLAGTVQNVTLPRVIFGIWDTSGQTQAAAAASLVLAFMIPLVFLYWFFGRRILAMRE
jgi:iron(III) transport system permease protein